MDRSTRFLHDDVAVPPGFAGLSLPEHHATTVVFRDSAALLAAREFSEDGYFYGLSHTPTTLTLAKQLAAIEGGAGAVLVPSGLAAIALTDMALLRAGDRVLLPKSAYGPNRAFAAGVLSGLGIAFGEYDPLQPDVGAFADTAVKLVWIEAPGSITMDVPDIARLIGAAHDAGAKVAVDNTWSAGVFFRPLDAGADFAIQALSKYQGGSNDVLMGAVISRTSEDHDRMKRASVRCGYAVSAGDCFLVHRALGSMWARLRAHGESALTVARALSAHDKVQRVLHPALPESPGHEQWLRSFTGSSGLFSFSLTRRYGFEDACAFVDALRAFKIGYSWGGATSLATPYRPPAWWPYRGECNAIVRLHVGLEAIDDLLADVHRALEAIA